MVSDQTSVHLVECGDQTNRSKLVILRILQDLARIENLVLVFHLLDRVQQIINLAVKLFARGAGDLLEKSRAGIDRKSIPALHDADETKSFIAQISNVLTWIVIQS